MRGNELSNTDKEISFALHTVSVSVMFSGD